jgi:hypothetical protein
LRKAGVKFSPQLLKNLPLDVVKDSTYPEFNQLFERQNVLIKDKITLRRIQSFMEKQNIVGRAQTGKLMLSSERQIHLEMEIAHHLGRVGREFQSGLIDEEWLRIGMRPILLSIWTMEKPWDLQVTTTSSMKMSCPEEWA